MTSKVFLAVTAVTATLLMSACSQAPKAPPKEEKKAPAKAPEAVAAHTPYYEMQKAARAWAPDLLALTVKSGEVAGIKNEAGKAGVWTAVFVSPSKHEARTFRYAVVADTTADLRQGINVSDKQTWSGATPASKAFTNGEFIVDSDDAYKTAEKKAEAWLKKHPDAQAVMTLGSSSRFPAPVWHVMWGTTKNGFYAFVNATTGELVTR
jgi:hypothetical protein